MNILLKLNKLFFITHNNIVIFIFGGKKLDKNQKICCNVTSCKYNNLENRCELTEIQVSPTKDCNTKNADESMCVSYEYDE